MRSNIEQQVMASVGVIYTARQLVSTTALKLYVCAASLYGLARLVWVERVFENWSQAGLQNSLNFMTSAVLNTHVAVQLTLAVLLLVGVSLLLDFTRSIGGRGSLSRSALR